MIKKNISGSTLKMIAVITMLIDHVGAVILARVLQIEWSEELYQVYYLLRTIGRIAFPIYCFLLVEGFLHTRNRGKYALRLLLFALISEVPFDLALGSEVFVVDYQNVFFTLFIGLLVMWGCYCLEERWRDKQVLYLIGQIVVTVAGMTAAEFLRTDYGATGILCIMVLYLFRNNRVRQCVAGCAAFVWWEAPAVIAFLPILGYNGKRGWNIKYFFYLFYPVHLLILYLICQWMGIAGVPAV